MNFYNKCIIICFSILIIFQYNLVSIYATSKNNEITNREIVAPSAILIDAKTGVIIYEKNKDEINYPASITKVMTAILTLEEYSDNLYKKIYFSKDAVFGIPYDSSHIAMNYDETLTVEQALYAIMLASANEVSNALAEDVSGDNETFSKKMTQKANLIGAKNTNFVNPHGLHDVKHYSTAYDMALIMKEAIKHPKFLEIINTIQYEISPTEKQEESRILNNSHKMILPGSDYYYEYAIGGKTGFTDEAKHTLVTYTKTGEVELIAVVMHDEKASAYVDTQKLFNYGLTQFETVKVLDDKLYKTSTQLIGEGKEYFGNINVIADESVELTLPKINLNNIKITHNIPQEIVVAVKSGEILGQATIKYNDIELAKVNLLAETSVDFPETVFGDFSENKEIYMPTSILFIKIFQVLIVLFVSIFALKLLINHKKRRIRMYKYRFDRVGEISYRYKNNL